MTLFRYVLSRSPEKLFLLCARWSAGQSRSCGLAFYVFKCDSSLLWLCPTDPFSTVMVWACGCCLLERQLVFDIRLAQYIDYRWYFFDGIKCNCSLQKRSFDFEFVLNLADCDRIYYVNALKLIYILVKVWVEDSCPSLAIKICSESSCIHTKFVQKWLISLLFIVILYNREMCSHTRWLQCRQVLRFLSSVKFHLLVKAWLPQYSSFPVYVVEVEWVGSVSAEPPISLLLLSWGHLYSA